MERSQESSLAAFLTGNAEAEVNNHVEVSSTEGLSSKWLENNDVVAIDIVPESTTEDISVEVCKDSI